MTRSAQLTAPPLLRDHKPEVDDLGHIATLLGAVTDEGAPIPPDLAGAMSSLAYLANDRVDMPRKALSGVQT